MEKAIGKRFACASQAKKQPTTKNDDDEEDSEMTLNRYFNRVETLGEFFSPFRALSILNASRVDSDRER